MDSDESAGVKIGVGDIQNNTGPVNVAGGNINVYNIDKGATVIMADGFTALIDLMKNSADVQISVFASKQEFKTAYDKIDQVGDYKSLHDLLHRIQLYCYNQIVEAALRFPDDELTLDNLNNHAMTLEEIIAELKLVGGKPAMQKQESVWMDEVGLAHADLCIAINSLDQSLLKKVIWRLNRLLTTQPNRINILLNAAARDLHLPQLLQALRRVFGSLETGDPEPKRIEKIATFKSGIDALGRLNQVLSLLVDHHDRWQALDVELRRIDASIDRDLIELEMSWPDIKLKVEPLILTYPGQWAIALKQESEALDLALTGNNPAKVCRGFRMVLRRATTRFYQVDIELKSICGEMRQIREPLAAIIGDAR
jgi:hypothetical protein